MKRAAFLLLFASSLLFSTTIKNAATKQKEAEQAREQKQEKEQFKKDNIASYILELKDIDGKISSKKSVWIKSHASYLTSLEVAENLGKIKEKIGHLQRKSDKSLDEIDELNALISKRSILTSQTSESKSQKNHAHL